MNNITWETRLDKAARDNGFDLKELTVTPWLAFSSSHINLKLWIKVLNTNEFVVALSDHELLKTLDRYGQAYNCELLGTAKKSFLITSIELLNSFLKRVFQLARSLPSIPLSEYEIATKDIIESTEVARLTKQRIGQDIFRQSLVDFWEGRCAVSGVSILSLLKASHIKPWSECESDAERLNVFNGILLSPNYDTAFDCGLISFSDEGFIIFSQKFSIDERIKLGLDQKNRIHGFEKKHSEFLRWHREKVLLN